MQVRMQPGVKPSTYLKPSIKVICCGGGVQVLAIDERATDEVIMYVWDATDARPVPGR